MGGIVRTALLPARPNCVPGGHTSNALAIVVTRAQVPWRCARRASGYQEPETRSAYPLPTEPMVPEMPRKIQCRRGVCLFTRWEYFFRRVYVCSQV
jgi:hypothetical protein